MKRKALFCELGALLGKLTLLAAIGFILLHYIFGVTRNATQSMQPAFQDGDLLWYYRLAGNYTSGEVVVIPFQGRELPERVVAVAGDSVDITGDGLLINGAPVQTQQAQGETTAFEGGINFPLTVPAGQVFVLGDNRPHAADSRIFGCVSEDEVRGRVIGLFRRRGF